MLDHPLGAGAEICLADPCSIADRLSACRQAFLAQPETRRLGCLQIVDLSRLRQRQGKRWPELRARVAEVIDAALARSLGLGDLSVEAGDDGRYVLRIGAERRELERQGELLAAEVTARLCGTIPGGACVRVSTVPFDLDRGLDGVTSVAGLQAQVGAAGLPRSGDGSPDVDVILERLRPRFRPILNLRKRLVSAYLLAVDWVPPGSDAFGRAQLDEWSVRQAARLLSGSHGIREAGLVVNLSYPTLAAMRWREPFLHQCRRLPRHSAGRLIFEVLDLPVGLPRARVRELVAYIRPFCRLVCARLAGPTLDLEYFAASGVGGLSVAAGSLPAEDHAMATALAALAGGARTSGLRSCLVETHTAKLCRAALAAGVDHLSGDELMPPLAQPGRPFMICR